MFLSSVLSAARNVDQASTVRLSFSLEVAVNACFTTRGPFRLRKSWPVSLDASAQDIQSKANRVLWQLARFDSFATGSIGGIMVANMVGRQLNEAEFNCLKRLAVFVGQVKTRTEL